MQKRQFKTEIIVVGNELLNGTTLDTNSQWMAKQIDAMGGLVTRKTTIRDNLEAISETFVSSIRRSPDWIFSLGGLGPTYDDMTLRGLSIAIGSRIERNPEAIEQIRESRERRILAGANLSRRLLPSTLKMAEIPKGSAPLRNSVGTAPGVLSKVESTQIVSLPGVPREMKAIFVQQVIPHMREEYRGYKRIERWLQSSGVSESAIAPYLMKLMKFSQFIYIKSHPLGFKKGQSLLRFQLSSSFALSEEKKATLALTVATNKLASILKGLGGRVRRVR